MPSFVLDTAGGAEVLKDLAAAMIADAAQQVADKAGDGVVVELRTTDRAKAFVRVPKEAQAKDGVLSRAAAQVGLQVRPIKQSDAKKTKANANSKTPSGRKRGRPRKNPEAVVPTVKRKRGRPRKNPTN